MGIRHTTATSSRPALLLRAPLALLLAALALLLLAPLAAEAAAPGTPDSVTVTRSDGSLTASWDAVDGATHYHVTYSTDGGSSWSLAAFHHATNSITFAVSNGDTYVVGVRAKNVDGGGGWRNSEPAGPYTPPPPPATPASVSVTRSDGSLTASWDAAAGATSYHVTYSTNGGGSWSLAAFDHATTSITISANNGDTYVVGVRAKNAGGGSGWVNSPASGPYTPPTPEPTPTPTPVPAPDAPSSVSVTRADGTLTASWDAPSGATKYHVTYTADHKQSWTAASDSHTGTSITISADNAATYYVAVRAGNAGGWSGWRDSAASGPYTTLQPGISVQDADGNDITALSVPEGGEASYRVKLTAPPSEPVKVCIGLSVRDLNDPSITFKGAAEGVVALNLNFTADNWDTFQTVTLVATEDDDYLDGQRDVGHDTRDYVHYWPGAITMTVTEIDNDELPAVPANFTITNGDGFFDLAWDASDHATGYDIRAKINNSASWSSVATGVTTTSYRYTTSDVVNVLAVRATNAGGSSAWSELTRGPNDSWLTTVQQAGASAQSLVMAAAQGQSQLNAPASITVTRDNYLRDEKLRVSWSAVSGASGYNLACAASPPSNTPFTGLSWWHCGSITSGSTTSFIVDEDRGPGLVTDLVRSRSYTVAVRAVTGNPAQASPWLLSADAHPAFEPDYPTMSVSRAAGSITVSWTRPGYAQGYEIRCATYENNVTGTYTDCADVENATAVNGRYSATISSWTAGGANYTIDDSKTYDLSVTTTNVSGESPSVLAPLIYPDADLTVSNIGVTTATLTIANYSANWYYKANAAPDNTCKGPVSGSSKDLIGLSAHTSYVYSAYSAAGCASADLLATAAQFTTFSSVSNLTNAVTGDSNITRDQEKAVAFTTGANSGGYTLQRLTAKLKQKGTPLGTLSVTLHSMQGTDEYDKDSQPSSTVLATLSGTPPTSTDWTDTTFTCSGSGCQLNAGTTYFIVIGNDNGSNNAANGWTWAYTLSGSETKAPTNNGWDLQYGHDSNIGSWRSYEDWHVAEIAFTDAPSLTSSNVSGSGATLTLTHYHTANPWYYKATTGPHTTCQGAVSGTSVNLTGLSAGSSYTYSAYSDSACTANNLLATASAFTTPLSAPTSLNLSFDSGLGKMQASWTKPSGAGSVGYELQHADSNRNNPYGSTTTIAATSASQVTHTFSNTLTVKFRVRAKVGGVTSAWAEYVAP